MSETAELEVVEELLATKVKLPTAWAGSKRSAEYHTVIRMDCSQGYGRPSTPVWRTQCGKGLNERDFLVTGIRGDDAKAKRKQCGLCAYAALAMVRQAIESAHREIRTHKTHTAVAATFEEAGIPPELLAGRVLEVAIKWNPAKDSKPGSYSVRVEYYTPEQVELRAEDETLGCPEKDYWR